jgi:hypothetical protein
MQGLPISAEQLPEILSEHGKTPLKSSELPFSIFRRKLDKSLSVSSDDLTFRIAGTALVTLFNRPDDTTVDAIIGTNTSADEAELGSQIQYTSDRAWLKYQVQGGAKADGSLEVSEFGFDASTDHSLSFSSYLVHDPDDTILDAVEADLQDFPVIVSADDVAEIDQHEAVAMEARGRLDLSVSVKWTDVFTRSLRALNRLVDQADLLSIEVDLGAQVDVGVEVEDDLTVIFSRSETGVIRAAVKRRDRHEISAGVGVGITAVLQDPVQIQVVLDDAVDALLGVSAAKLRKILSGYGSTETLAETDDDDLDKIQTVLRRLDLEVTATTIKDLREEVDELRSKVGETLKEIVESEVQASFSFAYNRLGTQTVLLEAVIDDDRVREFHGQVIRGNLRPLIKARNDDGVSLERFFEERTVEVSRSWGLGLKFGDWFSIGTRSKVQRTTTARRDAIGALKQYSFTGLCFNKNDDFGGEQCYMVRLEATMPRATVHSVPCGDEFTYGLTIGVQYREGDASKEEVSRWVDLAQVWQIINPGAASRARSHIQARASAFDGVTASFKVRVPDEVFRMVFNQIGHAGREINARFFGKALGEAMPWMKRHAAILQDPSKRRKYYGPLWASYLTNHVPGPGDLAREASSMFRRAGHSTLATFEGRNWRKTQGTIGYMAYINPDTRPSWQSFLEGARKLQQTMSKNGSYEGIEHAFNKMVHLWDQSFYVRALGIYILDLISQNPVYFDQTECLLTIDYEKGGKTKKVETFTSSAAPEK